MHGEGKPGFHMAPARHWTQTKKEMGGRCASRQRSVRILTNAQLQSGLQIIMYFKNPNLFRVRLCEGDFRAVTTCAYAR